MRKTCLLGRNNAIADKWHIADFLPSPDISVSGRAFCILLSR